MQWKNTKQKGTLGIVTPVGPSKWSAENFHPESLDKGSFA